MPNGQLGTASVSLDERADSFPIHPFGGWPKNCPIDNLVATSGVRDQKLEVRSQRSETEVFSRWPLTSDF
jgi:hypothetical protein